METIADIYIPTFGRADRLGGVIEQIRSSSPPGSIHIYCIVEPSDESSHEAAARAGAVAIVNHRTPNYAGAINSAWDNLKSSVFFCGADDLRFFNGWLEAAMTKMREGYKVVGTDDLHNEEVKRGEHATHYLVSGQYIKSQGGVIDGSAPVLFEGYDHNWTDREFIGTAKFRGVFTPCLESVVEHLHFTFGLSQMDDTYAKTRRKVDVDAALYRERQSLWAAM